MLRWLCGLVVAALLTGFTVLLVLGTYPHEGHVIWVVGPGHGVYQGDVAVMTGWLIGIVAVWILVFLRRKPASRTPERESRVVDPD